MEGIFHVHSTYSSDGKLSLEELREECLARNLKFMVVTEHAENFDSERLRDYLAHCHRFTDKEFIIVPGLEFNIDAANDSHLLVIGFQTLSSARNPGDILEQAEAGESGALVVLAHPSRNGHYIPLAYDGRIGGVEIWNAAYDSRYLPDWRSIQLYKRMKKKGVHLVRFGGLDLHDRSGFRDLKLCLNRSCSTEEDLLADLKAGRFTIKGPYLKIPSLTEFGYVKMACLYAGRKLLGFADLLKRTIVFPKRQA